MFNPAEDLSVFQYLVSHMKIERKSLRDMGDFPEKKSAKAKSNEGNNDVATDKNDDEEAPISKRSSSINSNTIGIVLISVLVAIGAIVAALIQAIQSNALAGTIEDYELSFEDGSRMQGKFLVQRLDYAGDVNGERNYTLQLESSGPVTTA